MKSVLLIGFDWLTSVRIFELLMEEHQQCRMILDFLCLFTLLEKQLNVYVLKKPDSGNQYLQWMRYLYRLKGVQVDDIVIISKVDDHSSCMVFISRLCRNYGKHCNFSLICVPFSNYMEKPIIPNFIDWSSVFCCLRKKMPPNGIVKKYTKQAILFHNNKINWLYMF